MKKTVYLVIGRTCAGKTTFARELCRQTGMKQLQSFTTRPEREEEKEREKADEFVDHVFITKDAMKYLLKNKKDPVIAYTKIGEYEYCTTLEALKAVEVYVIDPVGVKSLRDNLEKLASDGFDIPFKLSEIYVTAPANVREKRWLERGGSEKDFFDRERAETDQFDSYEAAMTMAAVVNNGESSAIKTLVGGFVRDRLQPMELLHVVFGQNLNDEYNYPLRREVLEDVFLEFLKRNHFDGYGHMTGYPWRCFENDVFAVNPYYWGDDEDKAKKPNFIFKPEGLKFIWYKYPLRDAWANQPVSKERLQAVLEDCEASIV